MLVVMHSLPFVRDCERSGPSKNQAVATVDLFYPCKLFKSIFESELNIQSPDQNLLILSDKGIVEQVNMWLHRKLILPVS